MQIRCHKGAGTKIQKCLVGYYVCNMLFNKDIHILILSIHICLIDFNEKKEDIKYDDNARLINFKAI